MISKPLPSHWNGRRYYSFDAYCRNRFGEKVYKLSLDGGFTCPNRDGKIDTRGCIFCSAGGSGDFAADRALSVTEQIESAKLRIQSKQSSGKYIAYFQAFTNTYAPLEILEHKFTEAISHPDILAISVATRPDCLPDSVIDLLQSLNNVKPVIVELGLQTIHSASAEFIRRGYTLDVYDEAVAKLSSAGLDIVTHLILGLPNESVDDMLASVKYVCRNPISGIKLSQLHILRNTDLADYYALHPEEFLLLTPESYINALLTCMAAVPEHISIQRITGDGPKRLLIAPEWTGNKKFVLNSIEKEMKRCDFRQGQALSD